MFTDMKVSSDTTDAYRKHVGERDLVSSYSLSRCCLGLTFFERLEMEMSITVMTSNSWPNTMTQSPPTCNLPDIMSKCAKAFEMFYLSRHQGRKLTWQLGLGSVDVKVAFNKRRHDLNVSTLALVILLLFETVEDDNFLTYEVIKPRGSHLPLLSDRMVGNTKCHSSRRCESQTPAAIVGLRKV